MQDNKKVLGVIPARLDSKRMPGKVLRPIAGKAMVHWVYDRARQSPLLSDLIVATDSDEVRRYCLNHAIPVTMTGHHASGSDRLHEVMERTDGDVYVNIQGDEPTLRADHLGLLLPPILSGDIAVTTLKVKINNILASDPNIVKVVTDNRGLALYFSRLPIPFCRNDGSVVQYYKHIGIYAYSRSALALFHQLPQSSLELAEELEQLRFLQNGIPIMVAETLHDTVGVDTEDDLHRAILLLTPDISGS